MDDQEHEETRPRCQADAADAAEESRAANNGFSIDEIIGARLRKRSAGKKAKDHVNRRLRAFSY
jgi:hypothetical protein